MTLENTPKVTREHFGYIDSLRGIAIIMVLLIHSLESFLAQDGIEQKINYAFQLRLGVQLFFILSAFTIMYSLKSNNSPLHWKGFIVRRFFRIAPMFYLCIIYYFFQNQGFQFSEALAYLEQSKWNVISHFAFLFGFNPWWLNSVYSYEWTIGTEMPFYFLVIFIAYFVRDIRGVLLFVVLALVFNYTFQLFLWQWYYPYCHINSFIFAAFAAFSLPYQLPIFCIGIVLFHLIYQKVKTAEALLYLSLLGIILSVASYLQQNPLYLYSYLLILVCWAAKYNILNIFDSAFLRFIGKISYSIYLVHGAILYWLKYFGTIKISSSENLSDIYMYWAYCFIITSILTVAISFITNQLIEVPFQNLGKKISKKLNP